jgi:hypothetical protein
MVLGEDFWGPHEDLIPYRGFIGWGVLGIKRRHAESTLENLVRVPLWTPISWVCGVDE